MDYREQQQSQFVLVSGLQKLTQELGLCLHLEMVDIRSHFQINHIKTYVNCVRAQSFIIARQILSHSLNQNDIIIGVSLSEPHINAGSELANLQW